MEQLRELGVAYADDASRCVCGRACGRASDLARVRACAG
jgi:hypothetical protein